MGIKCEISLCPSDDNKYEYKSGSTVSGAIKYYLDEEYEFSTIVVSLKGQGRLYFEDKHKKRNDRMHTYGNKETYVDIDNVIYKNESGKPLVAGEYETPFSLLLPHDVPGSLDYTKNTGGYYCRCYIKYYVRIKFERPGLLNMNRHFKKEIQVASSQIPRMATEPLIYGEQKSLLQLSSLFSGEKSIVHLKATIVNSVLKPGEGVKVNYEVENNTNVDIKRVEVKLLEVDTYTASGGRKVNVKSEVENTEFTYGAIKAGETAKFAAEITIPSLCVSYDHSKIFGRDYSVLTTVVLPIPHINLPLEIPFQVIDRLSANFEEGNGSASGYSSDAPPSYWEAMGEDQKEKDDQDGFEQNKKGNEKE
ncbi:uncharacterized protein [Choristoneura fumiferana]|uniref:uncharacterized protein n=1 Tax=Choristoneura fumiferana TaxID=7141 RepID=UPI003D1584F1